MKRLIPLFVLFLAFVSSGFAAANDFKFEKRRPDNSADDIYRLPDPAWDSATNPLIFSWNGTAYKAHQFDIAHGFKIVTGELIQIDPDTMPTPTGADARMTTLEDISSDLGSAAFEDTGYFATAAQGALASTALQSVSWTDVGSKPTFANVATSGAYADLSGLPTIPAAQVKADWNASGTVAEILNKPTIPAAQVQTDWSASSGLGVLLNKPTIPTNTNQLTNGANFVDASGARGSVSLTTTGTGAASYNSGTGVLNIPTPSIPSASTVAVNAPLTNAGTSTAANLSISAATTSTAGTLSAADKTKLDGIATGATANVGTVTSITAGAGLNGGVITSSGTISVIPRSFNNTASKTLVTSATGQGGVVLDASRDAAVTYSVSTSTTATIGGASSVTVYLEIATTNSATAGDWTAIQTVSNGQTITLAIVLQSVQTNTLTVSGLVPAGYYVRVRTATAGTASATYVNGQEVKL